MNKRIKRLGIFLLVCYVALFGMLNWLQVFHAESLKNNEFNARATRENLARPRGTVETADGVVVARSVEVDDPLEFQRQYPEGPLYAHITGFFPINGRARGIEDVYNDELAGQTFEQELRSFGDLFVDKERTGNVTLTIRDDVQRVARDQLAGRRGSVVVMDPRTGGILAMYSEPTYDPNALSSHDGTAAADAFTFLNPGAADTALLSAAYQRRFFPGSTMKIVTGSTGVNSGQVTADNPVYPQLSELDLPQTDNNLSNFDGEVCGGALIEITAISCNTSFAQMGLDLGPDTSLQGAEAFGFNQEIPIDLPDPAKSNFPTDLSSDDPFLAFASIGQGDVEATPLQMALVASGVANDGLVMRPHVMQVIRDGEGATIKEEPNDVFKQAINADSAALMRQAMLAVVADGTGTNFQIPGVETGGKTGTAQLGNGTSHAWFIGFAGPPGGEPEVAVAVIVERVSGSSGATGGEVAAPVARAVVEQALQDPG